MSQAMHLCFHPDDGGDESCDDHDDDGDDDDNPEDGGCVGGGNDTEFSRVQLQHSRLDAFSLFS